MQLEIVINFYDASLDGSRWSQALSQLQHGLDGDCCALGLHNYDTGNGRLVAAVGIGPDMIESYGSREGRNNVWLQRESAFETAPAVIDGQQIVTDEDLENSLFYQTWLKPQSVRHHVFAVIDRQGPEVTFVMCGRSASKGAFEEGSLLLLQQVVGGLRRGILAGRAVNRVDLMRRAALGSMDAMPLGVAFLDRTGALVAANRIARKVIETGAPLIIANGCLAIEQNGRRIRLRDMIARVNADAEIDGMAAAHAFSLSRSNEHRPLTMMLAPIDERNPMADDGTVAAVLYMGDAERPVQMDHVRVGQLYGLSRAESRVAALLASGYRLDEAAEILGVAYETVRKHLKQIFGKTGTFRQAELVRMLVTGPAGLSL
jgi:DNA-binding CsgD family transcriptional regulator